MRTPFDDAGSTPRQLVDDVQRFGLLSASMVVDRYSHIVDRVMAGERRPSAQFPPDRPDPGELVDATARMAQAYLGFLEALAPLMAPRQTGPRSEMERILLPAAAPGTPAETAMWVHHLPSARAQVIEIEATALVSFGGVSIPAAAVSVDPPAVERQGHPPSRELRLRVDVPADQPAGHYHGLVLMSEEPDDSVAIRLKVVQPPGDRS